MEVTKEKLSVVRWRRHPVRGASRRRRHAATCVGRRVYIVGGISSSYENLNDVVVVEKKGSDLTHTRLAVDDNYLFEPKNSHSSCLVNDKLYVVGGYRDGRVEEVVCMFDVVLNSWEVPGFNGEPHEVLNLHTAEYMEELGQIVFFGGTTGSSFSNDVTCLQVKTLRWEALEPKGEVPQARSSSASYAQGSTYYIFGGQNYSGSLSDLWVLQFVQKRQATWSQVASDNPLRARDGCCFVQFCGKVLLFGGLNSIDVGGVDVFDPSQQRWIQTDGRAVKQKDFIQFVGEIPTNRSSHTMTNLCGDTIVLYGGRGNDADIEDNIYTIEKIA